MDVISIRLNVPPRHASRYNLQVKNYPRSQIAIRRTAIGIYDLSTVQFIQSVGKMFQDLFHSDNDKVNATLTALDHDFMKDKKKCGCLVTAGGCHALVQLLKKCLDKKIYEIPAYEQVAELNKLADLSTLDNTLSVIIRLTFQHAESRSSISAIGGVEAVVKTMETFPMSQILQECACASLVNLTCCSISLTNTVELELVVKEVP